MSAAPFPRTTCACPDCVACCKRQPGPIVLGQLEAIAAHLGETVEQTRTKFWASGGAVVMKAGRLYHTGSITPKHDGGRCVFLDDADRCTIHPVAPAGCAIFDTHMPAREANPRSYWMTLQHLTPAYRALRATLDAAPGVATLQYLPLREVL